MVPQTQMVRKKCQVESRLSGCVTVCMLRCRNSGGRRLTQSLTSVYVMILCVDGCVSKYFWAVRETFSHLLVIAPSGRSCTGILIMTTNGSLVDLFKLVIAFHRVLMLKELFGIFKISVGNFMRNGCPVGLVGLF